jgi:hypothetical protein
MHNLAKKLDTTEATQLGGYVVHIGEGSASSREITVRAGEGSSAIEYTARRATSCLLDPMLGDHVLVAVFGDGRAFVLAVLERTEEGPATASLDRDLTLRVPNGSLHLVAKDGVGMVTTGDVSIVGATLDVKAGEGRVSLEKLAVLGRQLLAEVASVKVVAGAVDTVMDRWVQKVKRAYRTVEELDQLRSKRVDYSAEKSMHLSAENTLVTATELVKLDGEHIHLG